MATSTSKTDVIPVRIEKRLKVTIDIEVDERVSDSQYNFTVTGFDSKIKKELSHFDQNELHHSKDSAVLAGFDVAYSWISDLRERHHERSRYNAVLACIEEQAGKVQPGWEPPQIPDTEEEAEAKEMLFVARPLPEDEILELNPFLKSLDAPLPFNQALTVPRNCILPSPDNPRDHFALKPLQELAATIKEHGQQQPITVFWNLANELEIIDGERRFRASEQAELPTVSIIIRDVTIAEAIELRGIANLEREDLTPIEVARWQQQLIEKGNYSQRSLAKKLKISQAKLAESLALLKLPEAWQQQLITHVITPTMARELVKWKHRENVLEKALKTLNGWQQLVASGDAEELTTSRFEMFVREAVNSCSQPVGTWGCPFKVTKKYRDELDIEGDGQLERAFNTKLWNKLAKEAKARQKKKAQTPSASAMKKAQQLPIHEWRLHNHQSDWLCEQIALKIEKLPKKEKLVPLQLLLMFTPTEKFIDGFYGKLPWLQSLNDGDAPENDLNNSQRQPDLHAPLWRVMRKVDAKNRDQVIRDLLLHILRCDGDGLPIDYLFAIAVDLGVDFDEFRPSTELLEDYTEESLRAMPAAARVNPEKSIKDPDSLIESMIQDWQPGEFPPGWLPEYVQSGE